MLEILSQLVQYAQIGNFDFSSIAYSLLPYLSLVITAFYKYDKSKDRYGHIIPMLMGRSAENYNRPETEFDFIIVGGGTSGGVIANRLSQDFTVLLLEAGGEPFPLLKVPLFTNLLIKYPQNDWMYSTTSQEKSFLAAKNRVNIISQGKQLGGSGEFGYQIHLRGNPQDFDRNWANITQDDSYSYDGLLNWFRKSENYFGEWGFEDVHGHGGPVSVQTPSYTGMAETFIRAGQEFSYNQVDLNGRSNLGFDKTFSPLKRGRRQGNFEAYIKPIRRRKNLTIRKFSQANKILMKEGTTEVYGVQYERFGKTQIAFSKKEIIISAGAIGSPKLLMLSGIGPKKHLEELGIPSRLDLPGVGSNLQDHVSVFVGPFFVEQATTLLINRDIKQDDILEYLLSGQGYLTTSGFQSSGFISTNPDSNWPDIHLQLYGIAVYDQFTQHFSRAFNINEEILSKYLQLSDAHGRDSFFILTTLARPVQKGYIKLQSKNPQIPPEINPRYLENDQDIRTLVQGIRKGIKIILNSTAFSNLGVQLSNASLGGCSNFRWDSDLYWECYARHFTVTLGDLCCTNSMGPRSKKLKSKLKDIHNLNDNNSSIEMDQDQQKLNSVVDIEFRVKGVKGGNLRVIDASIIPTITSANLNAISLMLGEKGAHLIKESWIYKKY